MRKPGLLVGIPSLDVFIAGWLPQLPQAERISITHAKQWYAGMVERADGRFAWQFNALKTICCGEIGEIAQRAMGYSATHATVEEIIDQKLMRSLPARYSKSDRRDALAEQMITSIFKEDYGAESQRSICREIGSHKIGWMSGRADDVVIIGGALTLVAYRAYSPGHNDFSLLNQAQLHAQDYLLADSRGIAHLSLDELAMRHQPLAVDTILVINFNFAEGITSPIQVPYSGKLMRTIIEAGDAVWMHIQSGEPMPEWLDKAPEKTRHQWTSEGAEQLLAAEVTLLKVETALALMTAHQCHAKDQLIMLAKKLNNGEWLAGEKLLSLTAITTTRSINKDKWFALLNGLSDHERSLAITMTTKPAQTLDKDKAGRLLKERSIPDDSISTHAAHDDIDQVASYCLAHDLTGITEEANTIAPNSSPLSREQISRIDCNAERDTQSLLISFGSHLKNTKLIDQA